MDQEQRNKFMTGIRETERRKEGEILSGYRGRDGEYLEQYAYMKWESQDDPEALALAQQQQAARERLARSEEGRMEREQAEREALQREASDKPKYRINLLGKQVPIKDKPKKGKK